MENLNNRPIPDKNNDDSDLHNDELGENSGDDTIIASEDAEPGKTEENKVKSSNTGQGPAGEGL
ncbi:hypothetical protein [Mucilaginibacter celer]|uniref:Uncharacterized protein n=1 Tax=Mucilaginibacter celer TaxID=2305508 RepID=A0A494VXN4_9SPHI|nr:hypothetical protein [Mucilaginibacter celer]AYL96243.1 hypothetical protein HYN43_013490 [Mucilaginibacter celer]